MRNKNSQNCLVHGTFWQDDRIEPFSQRSVAARGAGSCRARGAGLPACPPSPGSWVEQAGSLVAPHVHHDMLQIILAMSGDCPFTIDDERHEVRSALPDHRSGRGCPWLRGRAVGQGLGGDDRASSRARPRGQSGTGHGLPAAPRARRWIWRGPEMPARPGDHAAKPLPGNGWRAGRRDGLCRGVAANRPGAGPASDPARARIRAARGTTGTGSCFSNSAHWSNASSWASAAWPCTSLHSNAATSA